MKKQNKKVRIGLRAFFVQDNANFELEEWGALVDFASGASLRQLAQSTSSDKTRKAVNVMRRLGVKRSRAKVREYLTKRECEGWRTWKLIKGEWWTRYESPF